MQGPLSNPEPQAGRARAVLDWAQCALLGSSLTVDGLSTVLASLAEAGGAPGVGIASADGGTLWRHGATGPSPFDEDPTLAARAAGAARALVTRPAAGGACLVTAFGHRDPGSGWLLWLQDPGRDDWSAAEASALAVAGLVLGRALTAPEPPPRWAAQLERAARQQALEASAVVVRRLAHDFGNVLTGILGFSELSLGQVSPPGSTLHGYLTEVYRAAQNGAQLTHHLRQFARRSALKPSSSPLVRILSEELSRFGAFFEVRLDLPSDPPAVVMEGDQVRQLLNALLTNAREALAGPGSVEVSVRVRALTEDDCLDYYGSLRPGTHLEVTVADNGPGLTAEARRCLFVEPFFTTKPRRRGLGLMVAYGVLHAHGGGLLIEPNPGRGTRVRLVLPVAAAPTPQRGERILVVEKDVPAARLLRTTLEGAGYRVTALSDVADAQKAYQAAAADPYHLVLADLGLSEGNGFALARRLCPEDALPVLFLAAEPTANPASERSATGLVARPFRPEALLRAVRQALAGNTGPEPGVPTPAPCQRP